jgi:O-antigen/teichoic acid export membrane protein
MNVGNSIRSGVKWLFASNVGSQLIQFAFGIALARLLVPADFGMIATLQIFTGFVGMLMSGGMGQSLIRAKEATNAEFEAVFTLQLALGVLVYVTFFLSAPAIARYFNEPLYTDLLRVSALSFVLRPFAMVRISWLTREMAFRKRALIDISCTAFASIVSVLLAMAGFGVWSLTLSGLIGALALNVVLSRATPLRLRLNLDVGTTRKHGAFGLKITAGDFLTYFIEQSTSVILSKLAGPGPLGIFTKAESLARMPNRMITPPTSQTIFRALSKAQDDLDQSKYIFYRTVTLLMVYVTPFLVGMWWVAEPFIGVVYGEKWLPTAEPLRIMILVGFIRTVGAPSWVLLAAQNRMGPLLLAQVIGLAFAVAACLIGLNWGLKGVAWASVATTAYFAIYYYCLVHGTIRTRIADLLKALGPGLLLGTLLFAVLACVNFFVSHLLVSRPELYLAVMVPIGALTYTFAFLFLPIPSLRSEAMRWRQKIRDSLGFPGRST